MALLLMSLMVLGLVDYGLCQGPTWPAVKIGCSAQAGYVPGNDACCRHFVFAHLYRVCCAEPGTNACYCDGDQFGSVCGATTTSTAIAENTTISTTTISTTTTDSTTTSTTTSSLPRLCPASQARPQSRLLGGETITEPCAARGVVSLTGAGSHFCNAAVVHDSVTGGKVLLTLTQCWDAVKAVQNANINTTGVIAGKPFPLDKCTIANTTKTSNESLTTIRLSDMTTFFVDQHVPDCASPGCVYNSSSMYASIDINNCFIVSYGFNATGSRAAVKMSDVPCADAVPGTQCFSSIDSGSPCLGDAGAPVYCSLNTGEVALYGFSAFPTACSSDVQTFTVFPVSL